MTEKRFEWDNINIAITDTQNRKKYWIDVTCIDEIVDLLNELSEKNEQLKSTINTLTHDNTKMKKVLNTTKNENEQLKKVFRELITSGYWDDDYLTEQDWNDLKRWIENVFEKVMMNDCY